MTVVVLLVPLILIPLLVLGGAIVYQLVRQQGRLLIRLEAIEERLAQLRLPQPAGGQPTGLPLGTPAPPFELPALDGRLLGLAGLVGHRVLLVFLDPTCGFCGAMAPDLAKLD